MLGVAPRFHCILPALAAAGPILEGASGLAGSIGSAVAGPPAPPQESAEAQIKQTGSKSKDVFQFFSLSPVIVGAHARTFGLTGSSASPSLTQRREFAGGEPTAAASFAKEGGTATATARGAEGTNMLLYAGIGIAALFLILRAFRRS